MFLISGKETKLCECKQVLWLFKVVETLIILATLAHLVKAWHVQYLLASCCVFFSLAAFSAGSTWCMHQWFCADDSLITQSLSLKYRRKDTLASHSLFLSNVIFVTSTGQEGTSWRRRKPRPERTKGDVYWNLLIPKSTDQIIFKVDFADKRKKVCIIIFS